MIKQLPWTFFLHAWTLPSTTPCPQTANYISSHTSNQTMGCKGDYGEFKEIKTLPTDKGVWLYKYLTSSSQAVGACLSLVKTTRWFYMKSCLCWEQHVANWSVIVCSANRKYLKTHGKEYSHIFLQYRENNAHWLLNCSPTAHSGTRSPSDRRDLHVYLQSPSINLEKSPCTSRQIGPFISRSTIQHTSSC